jgi:adapter protein MecA 1/2
MEIQRIGNNKIRCALSENEIRGMGFEIDDIIADAETTQKFMRLVMEIVEEEEHIDMENISPIVKAELLQDHSMTITFGSDLDIPPQTLVETMKKLLESFMSGSPAEVPEDSLLGSMLKEAAVPEGKETDDEPDDVNTMICALAFDSIEEIAKMVKVCFGEKTAESSLFRLEEKYYLLIDFNGWTKEELRTFAFGTVEYDHSHFSEIPRIAYVMEHGKCVIADSAIETLRQL